MTANETTPAPDAPAEVTPASGVKTAEPVPPAEPTVPGAPAVPSTDVSRLLGLHTEGAHLVLGLYILSNAVFTFATADVLDRPWASYVAMILLGVGGVILARPHPDPFPLRLTFVVLGLILVSTVLVSIAVPSDPDASLGRSTWHIGAATWLLWFLILRRRVLLAWLGGVLVVGITVAWAVMVGRSALWALLLVQSQVALLVIASLFGAMLRRTATGINELNDRLVRAAAVAASVEAARETRLSRFDELAASVVPLLERIAAGGELSEADRREFATAEAQLRDGVRGRSLSTPTIVAAVASARDRGLEVTLLDDRGEALPSAAGMRRISDLVAATLDGMAQGAVTIRLLPAGREVAVTVVTRNGDATTRLTLTGEGAVAS